MSRSRQKKSAGAAQHCSVRIIGGQWRGRRVSFPQVNDVRPTGDRLRETLFNWLAPVISGARCLDVFAGSGALGLEALSRGAAKTIFVDQSPAVVQQLRTTLATLACADGDVVHADSVNWLMQPAPQACDVVFLDPPFTADCLPSVVAALQTYGWVAPGSWVYVERSHNAPPLEVPADWRLHRDKKAGEVTCSLYQCL